MRLVRLLLAASAFAGLAGCSVGEHLLNPFYTDPTPQAFLGEPNSHALDEGGGNVDSARAALEHTGDYQRARLPQPENPVMKPAVVRLMWIPDHLNKAGDLVPAHYYYVKVKKEDWAVTDAFELEGQLGNGTQDSSAIPFQYENDKK